MRVGKFVVVVVVKKEKLRLIDFVASRHLFQTIIVNCCLRTFFQFLLKQTGHLRDTARIRKRRDDSSNTLHLFG
jgi:hypothetical protein